MAVFVLQRQTAVVATETVYVPWSQKYLLSGPLRKFPDPRANVKEKHLR